MSSLLCAWVTGVAIASGRQSFDAVSYAGEFGFAVKPPLGARVMPPLDLMGILPELLGSGKLGTPCARMHFANASALGFLLGLAVLAGVVERVLLLVAVLEVSACVTPPDELLLMAATLLPFGELPPHPAISAATIAALNNTPIRGARRCRGPRVDAGGLLARR